MRKASSSPAETAGRAAKSARASRSTGRRATSAATTGAAATATNTATTRARSEAKGGRGRVPAPRPHATLSVEDILQRAIAAPTARARRLWARRGLTQRSPLDRTTKSLLLRQLYLAYFEDRRFEKASEISQELVALDVLPDVAQQDAARAKQALGDVDGAASHLRMAARVGPPNRKAFHFWTLGSLFFLARRYDDAIAALTRAARWGTTDKPLYQAHLALARRAAGLPVDDVEDLIARLTDAPSAQGYGRFVLGHLLSYTDRRSEARRHLEAFIRRTTTGRIALAIALDGEVSLARETLARL